MRIPGNPWIRPVLTLSVILGLGCAHVPVPRPLPATLPEGARLVASLGQGPCSGPFRAHLRLKVQAEGQRPGGVEGTLSAVLPDTLWLSASIGPFRPLFALRAGADSCQLLFHQEARYWVSPRSAPDWRTMNPAAWAEALGWALCPRSLLARFRPEGTPSQSDGLVWMGGSVEGTGEGTATEIDIGLEPSSWTLREFRVRQEGSVALQGVFQRYRKVAGAEVPTSFSLVVSASRWSFQGELRDLRKLNERNLFPHGLARPQGWLPVDVSSSSGAPGIPWSAQPN